MTKRAIVAWIDHALDEAVASVRANNGLYARALAADGYGPDAIAAAMLHRENWLSEWRATKQREAIIAFLDTAMAPASESMH